MRNTSCRSLFFIQHCRSTVSGSLGMPYIEIFIYSFPSLSVSLSLSPAGFCSAFYGSSSIGAFGPRVSCMKHATCIEMLEHVYLQLAYGHVPRWGSHRSSW